MMARISQSVLKQLRRDLVEPVQALALLWPSPLCSGALGYTGIFVISNR
jgi:hypothetical protein